MISAGGAGNHIARTNGIGDGHAAAGAGRISQHRANIIIATRRRRLIDLKIVIADVVSRADDEGLFPTIAHHIYPQATGSRLKA